ncbi:alanine--tRNA ligase [Candidatus Woesebacteria bacterium]|jgi:alanyl-tRNA synthetase|nr:alanine--tRNA ligase [Candidatus Woesebacteria bacterium]
MKSADVRAKFISFYTSRGHVEIPSAPLVPENDPTTLFTSSGMQPLIPYLLGQVHPSGNRLVDSQKSFRSQDIEEVGDNRHTTFFEMLGNWSLGDYFKKEQLPWIFEFLTKELGLDPKRLYVSVFEGNDSVAKDTESIEIWKNIFMGVGIDAKVGERIFTYPAKKNWWSRSGEPDNMPAGEPGGPDSEVFFDFGKNLGLHEISEWKNEQCHPNCDCGRFMEIANSVFMQYKKESDGSLKELTQKNVDFGGGLERMTAASNDDPDVFRTDLFSAIIIELEKFSKKKYDESRKVTQSMRVIADHLKAASFMINEGLIPGNKQQGYLLRRLIRRAVVRMHELGVIDSKEELAKRVYQAIGQTYKDVYFQLETPEFLTNEIILTQEINRFEKALHKGMTMLHKHETVTGMVAFDLLQNFGFPWELTYELALEKGQKVNRQEFQEEFKKHQDLSRTAAKGMFKGGLADHSEQTTRLHTAHHLLLAALQKLVDPAIKQRGSNITAERLRMDFNFSRKLEPLELEKVASLVNEKIQENLTMQRIEMDRTVAETIGAQMEFGHKYPDRVSVYIAGLATGLDPQKAHAGDYFSAEFCGGPHVSFTGALGHFTIIKEESAGAGVRRIYATLS